MSSNRQEWERKRRNERKLADRNNRHPWTFIICLSHKNNKVKITNINRLSHMMETMIGNIATVLVVQDPSWYRAFWKAIININGNAPSNAMLQCIKNEIRNQWTYWLVISRFIIRMYHCHWTDHSCCHTMSFDDYRQWQNNYLFENTHTHNIIETTRLR
jgi:hypothetical protein